jgi:predicted hydrocarbon binding protein
MFDIRKLQEQTIFEAVKRTSDAETAAEIVYGQNDTARSEDDPTWVASTMLRLEKRFDIETVKQIRMECQCGYGMDEKLSLLKRLKSNASNLEEFASTDEAKAAGLSYRDGQLYLKFEFCPCPMLAQVKKLGSMTWCQCSAGYSKVLFEKAFHCDVEVTMLKSIKCGDDVCLMRIAVPDCVWE